LFICNTAATHIIQTVPPLLYSASTTLIFMSSSSSTVILLLLFFFASNKTVRKSKFPPPVFRGFGRKKNRTLFWGQSAFSLPDTTQTTPLSVTHQKPYWRTPQLLCHSGAIYRYYQHIFEWILPWKSYSIKCTYNFMIIAPSLPMHQNFEFLRV
jgi:hypothetical protein